MALLALSLFDLRAQTPRFQIEEATIDEVQAALRGGSITCRALVEQYLARIDAYDKNGAALNAIVMVNPARARRPPTISIGASASRGRSGRCTACRSS